MFRLTLSIIAFFLISVSVYAQPIAYIGSNDNNIVSVLNVPTNQIVSNFLIENGSVSDIAISPDQSTVYFAGFSDILTAVNTSNNAIMAEVNVGLVNSFAVTPDGTRIFITSSVSDTLTVVSTSDYTITNVIPLGNGPDGISITPNGEKAYIADQSENAVYVVDTTTVTVTDVIPVPGGSLTRNICVEPNGGFVYVTSAGSDLLTVINTVTDTIITQTSLGDGPRNIAFNSNGTISYIPNGNSNDVSVIRTSDYTVIDTIPTAADNLNGISITPDNAFLYTTAIFSNDVTVISTASNSVVDIISGTLLDGLVNDGRFIANVPPPTPIGVPTMGEWGYIALAIVILIGGLAVHRRKALI